MRYVEVLGMFAIDRSIPASCVHRTEACAKCYNMKLYPMFKKMASADERYEDEWAALDPEQIRAQLQRSRKRNTSGRARLMTRGEAFSDYADVGRVRKLITVNAETKWWVPTRAWRHPLLRVMVEQAIMPLPNVALLASTDYTTTPEEYESLVLAGWSTMHFGPNHHAPRGGFHCPKTAMQVRRMKHDGVCAKCINGCFKPIEKPGSRVDVYLDQH